MRQYAFLSGVWQTRREKARSPGPSQAQLHIKCHLATTISIHCQLHQTPRTGELTKVSGLEPHGNTADAIIYIYMCILYIYILQMGTIRGYSVHKPRNISRDYPPTHCWLKCPFQGKQADPPLQPLKRWKTQTLGALETTLDNIRNRDHSVHRLSAVRALNLHRRRSTCVLLTSVKCKRS